MKFYYFFLFVKSCLCFSSYTRRTRRGARPYDWLETEGLRVAVGLYGNIGADVQSKRFECEFEGRVEIEQAHC